MRRSCRLWVDSGAHLQGGTAGLAYLSWKPEAAKDVGVLLAVAPVIYAKYLESPTLVAFSYQANVSFASTFPPQVRMLDAFQILPKSPTLSQVGQGEWQNLNQRSSVKHATHSKVYKQLQLLSNLLQCEITVLEYLFVSGPMQAVFLGGLCQVPTLIPICTVR
eukprot:1159064-Pelagomonas_calceolata.AAC.3